MDVGDRVQLKFLHKPIGTVTSIIPGLAWQGVVLVEMRYQVRWDDGEWGTVGASELLYYDVVRGHNETQNSTSNSAA